MIRANFGQNQQESAWGIPPEPKSKIWERFGQNCDGVVVSLDFIRFEVYCEFLGIFGTVAEPHDLNEPLGCVD
jgi:hypothetical protein